MANITRIALIGAGNLATHLGRALKVGGCKVVQVFSRTEEAARNLAGNLGCPYTTVVEEVTREADVYILSLKDSALEEVIARLCPDRREALFVHTAGSIPMSVFEGKATRYGVLYPMQTFSKAHHVEFESIPCFVEGVDDATERDMVRLAQTVTTSIHLMDSEHRRFLHLAAVFACNFVNHCYEMASELTGKAGINFDVMLPLIDETARKVHFLSPQQAQTGPAVRYDENVMQAQQQLLSDAPEMREIYALISKRIHEVAQKKK
jgi:predicted short-subunit dehydrogenase-like oxidoreductase (DUF2520 family)